MGGGGCSGRRTALVGLDSDVAIGCLLVRLSRLVEALGTVLPPSLEQVVAGQEEQEDDEDYDGYDVADVAGAHLGVVAVAQLSALRAAVSGGVVASAAQVLVADGLAAEKAAPVALAPVAVIQGTMFAVRQHQFAQSALGRRQRRRGPRWPFSAWDAATSGGVVGRAAQPGGAAHLGAVHLSLGAVAALAVVW